MEKTTATREGATPLALIAAGGEGKRLGSIGPKALVVCGGRPLLAWCLDAFAGSRTFAGGTVVVAAHASEIDAFDAACDQARAAGLNVIVTEGGPSRSHSVAAALRTGVAAVGEPSIVLVHDAARIFTTPALIDSLHDSLASLPPQIAGQIAARPVTDTIKLVDDQGDVLETPPRERLWAVQTPQAFRYDTLAEALGVTGDVSDDALAGATDDASLIESRGGKIRVFDWSEPNEKITTAEDLADAEAKLTRSGR